MKAIRKEYRLLTDRERYRLHRAINALKHGRIDNVSRWDLHTIGGLSNGWLRKYYAKFAYFVRYSIF